MLVTAANFEESLRPLADAPRLLLDVETTGVHPWTGDCIAGVSLCRPDFERTGAYYFPIRHERGENLSSRAAKALWRFLRGRRIYTGWNTKFDLEMTFNEGVPFPEQCEDVMLAAHLMNENEPYYKLKLLAADYVDPKARLEEVALINLLADRGLTKGDISKLAPEEAEPYATQDVKLTERMRRFYYEPLHDWSLWNLWQEVNQYSLVTARMEQRGLLLDVPLVQANLKEALVKEQLWFRKMCKMAGYEINPKSSKQLKAWLDVPSSAVKYLEALPDPPPAAKVLLQYRMWQRVSSAYYQAYLDRMDSDGVLHPNIKLHGTVAGRPSAEDPNLQAVPRYTNVYRVKDVFVARPGHVLISADYSQAELRLGAHYAKDEEMITALRTETADFHQDTSDYLKTLGLNVNRDDSKRINFGVWYGIGAPGLSKRLGVSEDMARDFLTPWHARHPNVRTLYNYMRNLGSEMGYIRLWSGRVRRYNTHSAQPHKALSNLIQGGVAEIMRERLTAMDEELVQTEEAFMLLQVHDQVLFETLEDNWRPVVKRVRELMRFERFSVPLTVDISVGRRWGKMTKLKRAA